MTLQLQFYFQFTIYWSTTQHSILLHSSPLYKFNFLFTKVLNKSVNIRVLLVYKEIFSRFTTPYFNPLPRIKIFFLNNIVFKNHNETNSNKIHEPLPKDYKEVIYPLKVIH